MKKILSVLLAFALCVSMSPIVNAEELTYTTDNNMCSAKAEEGKPCYDETHKLFFANGIAIVIDKDDTEGKTKISWEGGEVLVDEATTVFGGMHNSDTIVWSNITMNGGKLHGIFGGGLHKSYVFESEITLNDGTVDFIAGGGAAYFDVAGAEDTDRDTEHLTLEAAEAGTTVTQVDMATININGGSVTDVFGGGESYSYTGSATVTIAKTYTNTIDYVTGGGSNGYTGKAEVYANGGTIKVLQAVNRGKMDSSSITVDGATVTNLYASAEGDETSYAGVENDAEVDIVSGKVTKVAPGQNGISGTTKEDAVLSYVKGTIEETGVDEKFNTGIVAVYYTIDVTVDGKTVKVYVPEDADFTDEENITLISVQVLEGLGLDPEAYEVEGYYTDEELTEAFDFENISDETALYAKVVKLENPDTSDINLLAIGALTLVGLGGAIALRRKLVRQF